MIHTAKSWISQLAQAVQSTIVTDDEADGLFTLNEGVLMLCDRMRGRNSYLIGNGGSLAIAAHMATDFNLAGLCSVALCDPVALTSHANDFGVAAMFTKQLELARTKMSDVLIALSCSGRSENILDAALYAHASGMYVVTLSGFEHDNSLRSIGDLHFYVPAFSYGIVQLAHEAILHAACDLETGPRERR